MKTDSQIVDRLEQTVSKLEGLAYQLEALGNEPPSDELTLHICATLTTVFILGWVLDAEDLLNGLSAKLKPWPVAVVREVIQ